MHRDFKIGLISGMVVVIAATIYLATRPDLSFKRLRPRSVPPSRQSLSQPPATPDSLYPPGSAAPHESPPQDLGAQDWTAYEQAEKIQTQKFHIVRKTETLSDVARQYYGSPAKWQKIYQANRNVVTNPNALRPGTKLIIPD
jgi:nucleoid-associated protein YgaU